MFENIDFESMDVLSLIDLCLKCNTKEEAKQVLEQLENYCDTPKIARQNLGYIFGYCRKEEREKLYSLFSVSHPVFGEGFGRGKDLSPEEYFKKGIKIGSDKNGNGRIY